MEMLLGIWIVLSAISLLVGLFGMTFDTFGEWPMAFMGGFILFSVLAIATGVPLALKEDQRLLDECMKDHKEYECVSMLNGHDAHIAPIIIPVR